MNVIYITFFSSMLSQNIDSSIECIYKAQKKDFYGEDFFLADSDVYRKDNTCIKNYHIPKRYVALYNTFQRRVSETMGKFSFDTPSTVVLNKYLGDLEYLAGGTVIKKINVEILKTPSQVLDRSTLHSDMIGVISELPFIEGKTMQDIFFDTSQYFNPNFPEETNVFMEFISIHVLKKINSIFEEKFQLDMSTSPQKREAPMQISGINVKFSRINEEKGEIDLIMTDIASDIVRLIDRNEYEIDDIIEPLVCCG